MAGIVKLFYIVTVSLAYISLCVFIAIRFYHMTSRLGVK